jgi:hypothetical protein
MNRKLCFLILSLLLTTPYITGGDNGTGFADNTEIPNAHTMTQVRGRWKTVTNVEKQKKAAKAAAQQAYLSSPEGKAELAAVSEGISQRKKRLILKGDISFAPSINDQPTFWKINSSLPLKIDEFQSNMSWFAGFIRKTLTNAGFNRRQAKKLVKAYFPSNTAIRREARESEKTTDTVRYEYSVRQMVLHRYLSYHVNQWRISQVETFKAQHTNEMYAFRNKLVKLGGWEPPKLVHKTYSSMSDSAVAPMIAHKSQVMREVATLLKTITKWAEGGGFVSESEIRKWNNKFLKQDLETLYANAVKNKVKLSRKDVLNAAFRKRDELVKSLESPISEKRDAIAQQRDEYLASEDYRNRTTLHYKMVFHEYAMNKFDEFIKQTPRIPYDMLNELEENMPWTEFETSINWLKGEHLFTNLFARAAEFDFVHHPVLLNDGVTPWSLREALSINGTFNNSQRFISIPRNTAELEAMPYPELCSYAESRGIQTWIPKWEGSKKTNLPMPADQLVKACATDLHLDSLEDGQVLYELGVYYNEVFFESETFKNKWAGEVYSFTAPSLEVHAKLVAAEEVKTLISEFDF